MPTSWPFSKTAASTLALTLAALAITWESLKGPSWYGWVSIVTGLTLVLVLEKPRLTPMRWPILILIFMSLITLLVSADPQLTYPQVNRLLASIAGFVALVTWARTRQRLLFSSLVLIGAGTLVAAVAPFIVRWNLGKGVPIPDAIYKAFPLLFADAVHPNVMVSVMALMIPLCLAFLLLPGDGNLTLFPRRWVKPLLLLSLLMMSLVLFLTKSRGGYVAGAIGIFVVLWIAQQRVLVLVLSFLALVAALFLTVRSEQTLTLAGGLADPGTLAFRQQVWSIASWMIAEFPYSGVGMGAFNEVALRLYPFSELSNPGAHNLYFQVALDLGIPGLIAFASILLLTLYMSIVSLNQLQERENGDLRALCAGLLAGIIALMCHGLIDITVWGTRVMFLPWAIIALATAVHLQAKSQHLH